MDPRTFALLLYFIATMLFIVGIKRLSAVKTARQGGWLASTGMALAIIGTIVYMDVNAAFNLSPWFILIGMTIGSAVGWLMATRVEMTAMPQMVGLLNGLGGAASMIVGLSYHLLKSFDQYNTLAANRTPNLAGLFDDATAITISLSVLVGAVTLSGSIIAFLKLQYEKQFGAPILLPLRNQINLAVGIGTLLLAALATFVFTGPTPIFIALLLLTATALALGVLLVIPIGGADMPVVISLLNSYSGIAAAMTGFVIDNNLLIVTGALVGSSGIILTNLMCKAMNRSLANVILGGFGAVEAGKSASDYTTIKKTGPEEAASMLDMAKEVIIVPGFGLAVAQAQHVTQELATLLEKKGATVRYAIHPVAGRMPGHMNVLLAEANVPYEKLLEMDQINADFKNCDVALILGANDTVNPAALKDKTSPLWGMPILNVHEARTVIVVKRSLAPGFAGVKNELFEYPNTLMVFEDAKKALTAMVQTLKSMG